MSLEQALQENTAAVNALIAVMSGAKVTSTVKEEATAAAAASKPADKAPVAKKAPAKKAAPKVTKEQAVAAVTKIKDEFGLDEAKAVMSQFGVKLAEITDELAPEILAAADAHYETLSGGEDAGDDDSGL